VGTVVGKLTEGPVVIRNTLTCGGFPCGCWCGHDRSSQGKSEGNGGETHVDLRGGWRWGLEGAQRSKLAKSVKEHQANLYVVLLRQVRFLVGSRIGGSVISAAGNGYVRHWLLCGVHVDNGTRGVPERKGLQKPERICGVELRRHRVTAEHICSASLVEAG
jgi:hypothetical protein